MENTVIVYRDVSKNYREPVRRLKKIGAACFVFLLLFHTVRAQTRAVKGVVLDAQQNTVIGATVTVKGTTVRAGTNENGEFSINVPETAQTLVVAYIGMVTQEVDIRGKSSVRIVMKDDVSELKEVVVVGYGTQKKATVIGAVTQTSARELERTGGVSNVAAALTGNLPGLITTQSSGMPGEENPQILIRGQSSWNNSAPLILVDGVERPEFFAQMDVGSVESISVLKDASATAVYGSRGANGVIIVTTKRGVDGRAEVTGRVSSTFKTASQLPGKLDAYDAIGIRNMAIERELGASPGEWNSYIPEGIRLKYRNPANVEEAERYPNIDWQSALFKDYAMAYNANLGIRGGTKFTKYFASLDYQKEGDLMRDYDNNRGYEPGYDFNRINVRSNLDFQLTPSTVFKVDLGGTYGIRKTPWQGGNDNTFWQAAYTNAPDAFMPLYSNGLYGFAGPGGAGTNSIRALAVSGLQYITTATIMSNFVLEQKLDKLLNGLNFRGTVSLDNRFREIDRGINDLNNDAQQFYIDPRTGQVSYSRDFDTNSRFDYFEPLAWTSGVGSIDNSRQNGTQRRLYYQGQLNYARTFARDHNLTLMGVFSRQEDARGSIIPIYREDWVFRTTYNFKNKYLLEYNGAYNGSEKFGPGYRFAFFSSGGLGYVLSEENFMKSLKFVDQFKLRASYGEVGDDSGDQRFLFMDQWSYGGQSLLDGVGDLNAASPYTWYSQSGIGNPNIRWETVYKYNAGADFTFWGGLLSGNVDVFRDKRVDVLMYNGRAVPSYFGANAPAANIGRVTTQGYEFELSVSRSWNNIRLWADFAMTHAKSKVLFRDDPEFMENYRKQAGFPLGQTRSHVSQGYYNNWDELYGSTPHDTENLNRFPGGYFILDYNADGVIDNFDSVPYGYSNTPENTFNFNIGGEWKGLSLFLQFYGVNNVNRNVPFTSLNGRQNLVYDEGSYWSPQNMNADSPLPRFTRGAGYIMGSRYQYDGSYFRLKNAEIAYRFQPSQIRRLGLSGLRVFANGNNLLLWTKMPDDRESNFSTNNNGAGGAYPTLRRFNLGLNVTF
ncbi:TonB-dependent receptor [Pedobacter sp. SYSU D00535]|uniref:SusC/RagA family TonB-linked outer membrane protein n=1 Tax=Pedobacter sp. SYSU D00535 TaxID=2810308 RepID=UPI001A9622E5|nr:TonB-dependent receptor [Pedobacter sp. SYSU D00535]